MGTLRQLLLGARNARSRMCHAKGKVADRPRTSLGSVDRVLAAFAAMVGAPVDVEGAANANDIIRKAGEATATLRLE